MTQELTPLEQVKAVLKGGHRGEVKSVAPNGNVVIRFESLFNAASFVQILKESLAKRVALQTDRENPFFGEAWIIFTLEDDPFGHEEAYRKLNAL